jgi:Zn-dependent protease with chaperone function
MTARATRAFALVLAVAGPAAAAESLEEFTRRITEELEARSPRAAALFRDADAARVRFDHQRAADLYGEVYALAPHFVHALRRQCTEILALGRRAEAVALCRRAIEQERSPENAVALAGALVTDKQSETPLPVAAEALELAKWAADLRPDDPLTLLILCRSAGAAADLAWFRHGLNGLERVAPDLPDTHYLRALLEGSYGNWDDARRSLERARALGLSDVQYFSLRRAIDETGSPLAVFWSIVLTIGAAWIAMPIVLLAAGWRLSSATLRAAERAPAAPGGQAQGLDARLRRAYRVVLWLCCAYYYVSLPLVLVLVLAAGGGVVYGLLALGAVPVKLVALVIVVVLVTLWAMLKGIFVRGRDEDPGQRLDLRGQGKLDALLREVAQAVGTRPVDSVYMTPGTEVAVMERGGMFRQVRGVPERCLILGAGVLEGLRLGALKAILAHEYGHFSNEDTAGGGFALAVRRSLLTMAHGLASGGAAAWYNPAWIFLNAFYRIFLRISHGASRLQEVMADRWAAALYGAGPFEEGLRHVITRSVRFDAHVKATLDEVIEAKTPLANLYRYEPRQRASEADIERGLKDVLNHPPSPYDSHPAPVDRFAAVRAIPARSLPPSAEDDAEAWSLFADRDAIERDMTTYVRRSIQANHGIDIPAVAG